MKALISPNEYVRDRDGTVLGHRIVQIEKNADVYAVAGELTWIDCPQGLSANEVYWLGEHDGAFNVILRKPAETDRPPEKTEVEVLREEMDRLKSALVEKTSITADDLKTGSLKQS